MSEPNPMLLQGFPPVLGPTPRLLILGSMPSARSLGETQYYAHPRNRFWPLMGLLYGAGPEQSYTDRLSRLRAQGVAVWDVLGACERPGSLDTAIVRESEQPNDIPGLIRQNPSLRCIAFNGGMAAQAFARHFGKDSLGPGITTLSLPSTSPANATYSLQRLHDAWQPLLRLNPP